MKDDIIQSMAWTENVQAPYLLNIFDQYFLLSGLPQHNASIQVGYSSNLYLVDKCLILWLWI